MNLLKKVMLVMAAPMVMASTVMMPEVAEAGTNGQMVAVNSFRYPLVSVSGRNQRGQYVTWRGSGNTTKNWWWVGNVTVKVRIGHRIVSCVRYVPKVDRLSDVKVITCPSL